MADVFISYSRRNSDFARRLTDRLTVANKDSWVDWEGIPQSAPSWWDEIKAGIESANNFVFIMSPDSMASVVCNMELDYALELGKRIVPVMYQMIESQEAFMSMADYSPDKAMRERLEGKAPVLIAQENWSRLSHINWIYFRESDDFDSAFERLITTVDTDLEYVKAHTRYLTRAQEWQRKDKRQDLLLFGEEIDLAEAWLAQGKKYAVIQSTDKERVVNPLPLVIQEEHITVSRQEDSQCKRLARSAQISIAVLAIAVVVGIFLLGATRQQVTDAQATLTPIPLTLSFAEAQVTQALVAQEDAEAQAKIASTQLANSQVELDSVSTTIADSIVTVTAIAIDLEIVNGFANTILQVGDDPAVQISQMNTLAQQYPDESLIYLTRGLLYSEQNNYGAAIADYGQAIALEPQSDVVYYNRGVAHFRSGDYPQAINDLDRAIEISPDYANAYGNRGRVYYAMGDTGQAIIDYTVAIDLNPQYAIAFYNRGIAYHAQGNYEQAISDYSEAITINPVYGSAFNNRGNAYLDLGDNEQAIADFGTAIEIDPLDNKAFSNRGIAYYNLSDLEQAITDFSEAIRINPQDAIAYNNRGTAYTDLEQYDDAIHDFDAAIANNPQYSKAYSNRGKAYANLELFEEAIADYDRAIDLNPQDATSYYNRGIAYYLLEDFDNAIESYSGALKLDPDYVNAVYNRGLARYYAGDYAGAVTDFDQYVSAGGTLSASVQALRDEVPRIVDEGQ